MSGEPLLHARLWRENRDLARACLEHPFVRGLGDGRLDREAFKRYVAQDAFFLRAFFGAYALAAAKCAGRLDRARLFHELMAGVLDELELHRRYASSLGIDLDGVRPYPACSAYVGFLSRTAWSGEVDEIVAAMTPCMRLYAFLGQELAAAGVLAGNPYREWIETYSSAGFEELAAKLEALLDEVARPSSQVGDAYRYAMQCELDFFSAPLAADRVG